MKIRVSARLLAGLLLALCAVDFAPATPTQEKASWWPADVEQALARSGKNRPELEKALFGTQLDQRQGMIFLIANMPDSDLRSLKASFLLDNIELAYQARQQVPWGAQKIPNEIFFNNILPYAIRDEARDAWRKELYELCLPLIKYCKTPSAATQRLNENVFKILKVQYSTKRKKAQQSPKESIETGLASCTGLSVLLSDACRSVAVPTRLVGTPLWANKTGNHTWVEIWDAGWHFTGACEPDPKGLDRGWFVGNASQAKKDVPEHAIYASSFQKTKVSFPLVWAPNRKDIYAENVTERYAKEMAPKDEHVRVLVRVWQGDKNARTMAIPLTGHLTVLTRPERSSRRIPAGETNDKNDMQRCSIFCPITNTTLRRRLSASGLEKHFKTTTAKEQVLEIELPGDLRT